MSVVEVVDVVVVGDGDMSAALPVGVIVSQMLGVALAGALVGVPVVGGVQMAVVDVVTWSWWGMLRVRSRHHAHGCGRRARGE